jgi:lysozyme
MSLRTQLIRDEGTRLTFYQDSRGNWTVGVGHKGSTPLTVPAVNQILNDDIASHTEDLIRALPFTSGLSVTRFNALLNMCFTMGAAGVAGFHDMIDCLKVGDYKGAATAIRDSAWHKLEAPERAERIAVQMETDVET